MQPASRDAEPRITVVVLAGGDARRLPGKLSLPVGGMPMLARVCTALSELGAPCIVAARAALPHEIATRIRVRVIFDEHPGEGPLSALVSAAGAVATPFFFAAAGDMPGISASFVARVIDAAQHAGWPDATVPMRRDGMAEPLAALYAVTPWLAAARAALARGRRNVTAALDGLRVAHYDVMPEDEPALANVNTLADYERFSRVTPAGDGRS